MTWLPIIIPVLCAIAALVFFRKRLSYWEPFIPIVVTILLIVFFKYIGVSSLIKDKEYWGNYVTEVRWYQHWDEWIEQTCTRSYPCGTDSKGNTTYCTETYDCSYRKDHPEYWTKILNDGSEIEIYNFEYVSIRKKFSTPDIFIDMNRDFYRIDGDAYKTVYPNTYPAFEFYPSEHTYENKVQASTSVFNYPVVKPADTAKYKLFDYPDMTITTFPSILAPKSIYVTMDEQKRFNYINGMLGMTKEVRIWVCLFLYPSDAAGFKQEAYWKRGNKNEFVICIGTDKSKVINWVHIFGWSKLKTIDIETRNYIQAQKKLNLTKLGDWLFKEIQTKWVRTSFDDFKYLAIEPPFWSKLTTWILALISSIGLYIWIVNNRFTSTDTNGDGYDEIDEDDDTWFIKFKNRLKEICRKLIGAFKNRKY